MRLGTLDETITGARRSPARRHEPLGSNRCCARASGLGLGFRPLHHPAQQRPLGRRPEGAENLHEQYLLPPLHAGWAVRRKTNHFQAYEEVAKKFAKLLGMDRG